MMSDSMLKSPPSSISGVTGFRVCDSIKTLCKVIAGLNVKCKRLSFNAIYAAPYMAGDLGVFKDTI